MSSRSSGSRSSHRRWAAVSVTAFSLLAEWVVEWCSGGVHGLGRDEFGVPAGVEADAPSLAVHHDVVVLAEQTHVG
jgi:hypothetical protein